MDDGGQQQNGRHRTDYYKGTQPQWNLMPQYQAKDQNALIMSRRIMNILAERDEAIEQRDRAFSERDAAFEERDIVIQQRDAVIAERDTAVRERDNAIAALHFQENTMNVVLQKGTKRSLYSCTRKKEAQIMEAIPLTAVSSKAGNKSKRTKDDKTCSSLPKTTKKGKKVGEDLNRHVTTDGSKTEWESQDLDFLNQINFDQTTMPTPVCSCTGMARHCYKWGRGGWQSSCCTTTISEFPLPQLPNKRHTRMGGRKMSGPVFSRLLTRLAGQGHDLSTPLDLKNYWAKHGTNRYITIK